MDMSNAEAMQVLEARRRDIELRYREAYEELTAARSDVAETEKQLTAIAKALDALRGMKD